MRATGRAEDNDHLHGWLWRRRQRLRDDPGGHQRGERDRQHPHPRRHLHRKHHAEERRQHRRTERSGHDCARLGHHALRVRRRDDQQDDGGEHRHAARHARYQRGDRRHLRSDDLQSEKQLRRRDPHRQRPGRRHHDAQRFRSRRQRADLPARHHEQQQLRFQQFDRLCLYSHSQRRQRQDGARRRDADRHGLGLGHGTGRTVEHGVRFRQRGGSVADQFAHRRRRQLLHRRLRVGDHPEQRVRRPGHRARRRAQCPRRQQHFPEHQRRSYGERHAPPRADDRRCVWDERKRYRYGDQQQFCEHHGRRRRHFVPAFHRYRNRDARQAPERRHRGQRFLRRHAGQSCHLYQLHLFRRGRGVPGWLFRRATDHRHHRQRYHHAFKFGHGCGVRGRRHRHRGRLRFPATTSRSSRVSGW